VFETTEHRHRPIDIAAPLWLDNTKKCGTKKQTNGGIEPPSREHFPLRIPRTNRYTSPSRKLVYTVWYNYSSRNDTLRSAVYVRVNNEWNFPTSGSSTLRLSYELCLDCLRDNSVRTGWRGTALPKLGPSCPNGQRPGWVTWPHFGYQARHINTPRYGLSFLPSSASNIITSMSVSTVIGIIGLICGRGQRFTL